MEELAARTVRDDSTLAGGRKDPACVGHEFTPLGPGGTAMYYRCARCRAVFIETAGRLWTLKPLGARVDPT